MTTQEALQLGADCLRKNAEAIFSIVGVEGCEESLARSESLRSYRHAAAEDEEAATILESLIDNPNLPTT